MIEEAMKKQEVEDQIRMNKPRVDQRQQQDLHKRIEYHNQLEEKKMEPQMRQDKLDKAIEGYSFRPVVQADPDRITAEIKVREIRKNTQMDKADKVNLFRNDGFTSEQLMGDIRYKISAALHDAGLSKTTYGQQVVRGIGPKPQPKGY